MVGFDMTKQEYLTLIIKKRFTYLNWLIFCLLTCYYLHFYMSKQAKQRKTGGIDGTKILLNDHHLLFFPLSQRGSVP